MWHAVAVSAALAVTSVGVSHPAVRAVPELSLRADAPHALVGQVLTYTAAVRTAPDEPATLVVTPPRQVTVIGLAPGTCRETPGHRVSCRIPAGASERVRITTLVLPARTRTLRATATLSAPDASAGAAVLTPLARGDDLAVRLSGGTVRRGFTVTVVDRGPRAVRHVVVRLGTSGARLRSVRGARCHLTARTARCLLGRLWAGSSRTLRVSTAPGRAVTVAATVTPSLGDPTPYDDTAILTRRV